MKYFKEWGSVALFALIAALFATSLVAAAPPASEDSEDLNVSVEVASRTWIDIAPDHIRWYDVNPGEDSTNFTEEEHGTTSHDGIVVRNIGSTNIKTVWFNASYPSDLPYGTGTLSEYDTANFVLLSKADIDGNNSAQMATTDYYYINKKEYAEATRVYLSSGVYTTASGGRNIPYIQTVSPTATRNITIGRLRDGANEYYWTLLDNPGGDCDYSNNGGTGPQFRIGIIPHNETNIGDIDLTSGCDASTCEEVTEWSNGGSGNYNYGYLNNNGNRWKGTVVRLDTDCQGVAFVIWNKDYAKNVISTPANSANYWLANTTATYSGTDFPQGTSLGSDSRSPYVLAPGEYYTGWLKLRLPWGVPAGTLDTGTITVLVSTSNPSA